MPRVSVILTSFNHARYLRESIDSVLSQSYLDLELIILDDASTDDSWNLIKRYSDSRIKTVLSEHPGEVARQLNKTIFEIANGEYIGIHHSDDIWEPDKLRKQTAFLDAHQEVGAVFTNASAIGEDSSPLTDSQHFYADIFNQPNKTRHEWLRFFFDHGNALCHPSILIRKSCYEACGPYSLALVQLCDLDMWVRICLKYDIHVLPEKFVRFRVRDDEANVSGSRRETRTRWPYEFYKVLSNYRQLKHFDELVKVFPSIQKYYRGQETELEFCLAMAVLEDTPHSFAKLFAQDILFDILSDPKSASNAKRLYGFDHKNFVALISQNDVFSRETVNERNAQISKLNRSMVELGTQVESQRAELSAYGAQAAAMSAALAQARDELAEAYVQGEAQRAELSAYAAQATKLNAILAKEREDLTKAYSQVELQRAELSAYAQQATGMDASLARSRDELAKAYGQVEKQSADLSRYAEQAASMSATLAENRKELADAYGQIERQRAELSVYTEQAAGMLATFAREREELQRAYVELESQRAELKAYAEQAATMSALLGQGRDELSKAHGLVAQQRAELDNLKPLCSIVIPTKNGGPLFLKVLEALARQTIWNRAEFIVVDSGSQDDTVAFARVAGARVFEIPPQDFNHGRTRDYAISLAATENIILMVQDAVPVDANMLEALLSALQDETVAGVYARQIPRADADVLTKRNLNGWLTGRTVREVRSIPHEGWYESLPPMEKYFFCNFDNVCSAIRKSVWQSTRFGSINFGEDIDWAERVLRQGHKIVFEPSAAVVHSHDRPPSYEYKRTYVCHRKLYAMFGLHLVQSMNGLWRSWTHATVADITYVLRNEKRWTAKVRLIAKVPILNFLGALGQYRAARDEIRGVSSPVRGV